MAAIELRGLRYLAASAVAGDFARAGMGRRRTAEMIVVECSLSGVLRPTVAHVAVLVTVFDFGGDPASDFVRMRMNPPFG
jgi:hypothetical protein